MQELHCGDQLRPRFRGRGLWLITEVSVSRFQLVMLDNIALAEYIDTLACEEEAFKPLW